jgi:hypothetical protein
MIPKRPRVREDAEFQHELGGDYEAACDDMHEKQRGLHGLVVGAW